MSDDALPDSIDAVVIGGGPGGLAAAAELGRAGVRAIVLEAGDRPGTSWTTHYDRLHLHTSRGLSGLPGYAIPRRYGRWVARDDVVRYLGEYAAHHRLAVRTGIRVERVDRDGDGWSVAWTSERGAGSIACRTVVVATGYNRTARLPAWPGLDGYTGHVVHSSRYRNPQDLGARDVLVVGPGNSGAEIAADLAESGVAVRLAVRTPPNVFPRAVAGIPGQALVIAMDWLPVAVQDAVAALMQRITVGDLRRYGIPRPTRGLVTQQRRDDVTPTLDVGMLRELRRGRITAVPAVAGFEGDAVLLADGSRVTPDAVVVATGFARGLEPLVGHLDVLQPSGRPAVNAAAQLPGHPGLFFLGYSNPLTGNLRQLGIDARRIARAATR